MAPIVFVAHRMAQAIVTLHGTTQSAEFTPQNALIESSYLAATFMLTFGLKVPPMLTSRLTSWALRLCLSAACREEGRRAEAASLCSLCVRPVGLCNTSEQCMMSAWQPGWHLTVQWQLLQMRWHLHVPVNAFFVAVTLLQNSYVCRAAWPGVPGALPTALSPGWPCSSRCPLR